MHNTICRGGAACLLFFLLLLSGGAYAQPPASGIITQADTQATILTKDILLTKGCFTVTNVKWTGHPDQLGTFENGASTIGFDRGLVLSTGRVGDISGPNDNKNKTFEYHTTYRDPDLELISRGPIHDMVVLEFDLMPTTDELAFEYVFASEEYCEFVGSVFNDAFGFFISGPGINGPFANGAENIARLPGSNEIVSTNSINHEDNSQFFINNVPANLDASCGGGAAFAPANIQFDGFTKALTASIKVIPCQVYHIRMVVADRYDGLYDSAVFLRAYSLVSKLVQLNEVGVRGNSEDAQTPYEGCGDAYLVLERIEPTAAEDLTVYFEVLDSSTAQAGVDYAALPDSFVISAGRYVDTLFIETLNDAIAEGRESLYIRIRNICTCDQALVNLRIADTPPLAVLPRDTTVCAGSLLTMGLTATGGGPPYEYSWSTGGADSLINLTVDSSMTVEVNVSDQCNQSVTSRIKVQSIQPVAELRTDISVCADNPQGRVPVILSGAASYDLTVDHDGEMLEFKGIASDTFWLPISGGGVYTLTGVYGDGCVGEAQGSSQVSLTGLATQLTLTQVRCAGETNGGALLRPTGGQGPYTYTWSRPELSGADVSQLGAGDYEVTITDSGGCGEELSFAITQPEVLELAVAESMDLTCRQGGSLRLTAAGGTGPYVFADGNGPLEANIENLLPATYTLFVTDQRGCRDSLQATIADGRVPVNARLSTPDILTCARPETVLQATADGSDPRFFWNRENSPLPIPSQPDRLIVGNPGNYWLIVEDGTTACRDTVRATVTQDTLSPQFSLAQAAAITCQVKTVDLSLAPPLPTATYQWQWTTQSGQLSGTTDRINAVAGLPGEYWLTATDPRNGCETRRSVSVPDQRDLPVFALPATARLTCTQTTLSFDPRTAASKPSYTYQWTTPQGNVAGPTLMVNEAGLYQLAISDTASGCATSADLQVSIDTLAPRADAGPDVALDCTTLLAWLDAGQSSDEPNLLFVWYTAQGAPLGESREPVWMARAAGGYRLVLTNLNNGCSAEDEVTVTENRPTDMLLDTEPPLCPGQGGAVLVESVTGGTAPYLYSIDNGQRFRPDSRFGNLKAGNYRVLVEDANGCRLERQAQVVDPPTLFVDLGESITIGKGDSVRLFPTFSLPAHSGLQLQWVPATGLSCDDCLNPIAKPEQSTTYRLLVTTEYGCRSETRLLLTVDPRIPVYIPTAFSPFRHDGQNDFFTAYGRADQLTTILSLRVFDRWGDLVFEDFDLPPNDDTAGWNGWFRGKPCAVGTYVYSMEIEFWDGSRGAYHGEVTIMD